MREATRTSRRWQTYAARSAFSGVLFSVLLFVIWIAVSGMFSTADLGFLGRGTFIGFTIAQVLLALLLSPLMTSQAIIEEIEDQTLETLVLTHLEPAQILGASVLSRIMLLLTIVLGALPVMTLVVTLGGVSAHEVVAVTVHTALTVVVTGSLGAFFALFTRSPFLAMFAAATYTLPMYLMLPLGYAMTVGDLASAVHFSPMMGPQATGWDSLLPVVAYAPAVFLMFRLGTPLFTLRVSNAHSRHSFDLTVWKTKEWLVQCGILAAVGVVVLPAGAFVSWSANVGGSLTGGMPDAALKFAAVTALFLWWTGALYVLTWVFLRLGVEVVDPLDALFMGSKNVRSRAPTKVWSNPVAWREARPRAWSSSAVPILFTWSLILLGLVQTGWWVIPGGLLTMGLLNAAGALLLTIWLATHAIENEVRSGTLEVLLATTMPSSRILAGKFVGVASPTLPLVLLSAPMLILGVPHMKLMDFSNSDMWDYVYATGHGLGAWLWLLPLWAASAIAGIAIALRAKKHQSSFGTTCGLIFGTLGMAALAGRLFPDSILIAGPARIIAPPLAGGATWWQVALSTFILGAIAIASFAMVSKRIRTWAPAVLAISLALQPAIAQAQAPALQDNFVLEAQPLADGIARAGVWSSVTVSVVNRGRAARGTLRLDDRYAGGMQAWTRPIELAEGARKEVIILYRPGDHSRPRTVHLDTPGRHAQVDFNLHPQSAANVTIAVIGVDPMGLTGLTQTWEAGVPGTRPRPIVRDPRKVRAGVIPEDTIPGHSSALRGFDWIVWPAADPSKITERQAVAIKHWVADGGHLFLTVTDTWRQLAGSPLEEALPVELTGIGDHDIVPLLKALGVDAPAQTAPIATSRLVMRNGQWPRELTGYFAPDEASANARDYRSPLWVIGAYGLGSVHVLFTDPKALPLSSRDLWRRLLWLPGDDQRIDSKVAVTLNATNEEDSCFYAGDDLPDYLETDRQVIAWWGDKMREHLSDIPGVAPLPMSWLLTFSALYLLVIGPGDYMLLKWMGRQPLTWITFPISIAVFSTIALVGTSLTKGNKATVTRVEVVDILPGTGLWRGTSMLGVFATRKTDLELRSGFQDGAIAPQTEAGFMNDNAVVSSEGPGALTYRAETWTLGFTETQWVAPMQGTVSLSIDGDDLTVHSTLPFDLDDVFLGREGGWIPIGALKAGEERTVASADATRPIDHEAWVLHHLLDYPETGRGHLHLADHDWALLGTTAEPIEPIVLEGLTPEEKPITMVRIPLTPRRRR